WTPATAPRRARRAPRGAREGIASRASSQGRRERVVVLADQGAQVRADRLRALEARALRRRLLRRLADRGTLGVVFQVPIRADGEEVPGRAGLADEDQVLREVERAVVRVFHLALA